MDCSARQGMGRQILFVNIDFSLFSNRKTLDNIYFINYLINYFIKYLSHTKATMACQVFLPRHPGIRTKS